jgi:hypothetical protein
MAARCRHDTFAGDAVACEESIKLRSYSVTAPRICSTSWSWGSWLIGRSRNSRLSATFFQFLDQEHLIAILAGESVWGRDQNPIKVRLRRLLT